MVYVVVPVSRRIVYVDGVSVGVVVELGAGSAEDAVEVTREGIQEAHFGLFLVGAGCCG